MGKEFIRTFGPLDFVNLGPTDSTVVQSNQDLPETKRSIPSDFFDNQGLLGLHQNGGLNFHKDGLGRMA
jgi:hypothetical protein